MVNWYDGPALQLHVIDVGLLEDCKACCPGLYLAVARSSAGGRTDRALVYWSRDNSLYEPLIALENEAVLGRATTALGDTEACHSGWDRDNTVTVEVIGERKPQTVTEDEALDGKNLALLGGEVIGFATATQTDEFTYVLSNLLRGRMGTDALKATHAVGDEFTVLETSAMAFAPIRYGDIDTDRYFKAVSSAGELDDALAVQRRVRAMNVRPIAPHLLVATRNVPAATDVTITWQRRTRGNFRLFGSTNMRLCCCDEPNYELEIWNNTETVVLRTVELEDVNAYAYTAAQQSADGIAPGDPIKVKVFQMSTSVGRGVGAYLSIA